MIALAAFLVRDRVVRLQDLGQAPLELPPRPISFGFIVRPAARMDEIAQTLSTWTNCETINTIWEVRLWTRHSTTVE